MKEFWKLIHRYGDRYSNAIIYVVFTIASLIVALILFGILHSTGVMKLVFSGMVQEAEFGGAFAGFLITLILLITNYNQSFRDKRLIIVGNVLFDDGQPVKDAVVFVEGVDRQKETDSTGWFEIEVNEQPTWSVRAAFQRQTCQSTVTREQIVKPIRLTFARSDAPDPEATHNNKPPTEFLSAEFAQTVIDITQEYINHVRQALYPNEINDFLAKENLPKVPTWSREWWEKVFETGCGPRGIVVTFLGDEQARRLLKLSASLNPISRSSAKDDRITALIEIIYGQSARFPINDDQLQIEYRVSHLREHINAIMQLNSRAKEIGVR